MNPIYEAALPLIIFFIGTCFGSFANVIALRWPQGQSFILPRSRCPHCHKPIGWTDNLPLISYLILRGKCRWCFARIHWRYPATELLLGVLFCAVYWIHGESWWTLELCLLVFGMVTVSIIDLEHYLIPDVLSIPGMFLGLLGGFLNPERGLVDSALGLLLGGGFLWATAVVYSAIRKEEGMGGGDIKLLAWIGAVLGWKAVPFIIIVSSFLGAGVGVVLAKQRGSGLKTALPFGPFISAAALIYILGGAEWAGWYLRLFWMDVTPFDN